MYNPDLYAIVFMEVQSMKEALKIQLKILKLSDVKPNFSELARQYGLDRRTVKKYYDGYSGKPKHHDKPSQLDKYEELIKQKLAIRGTTMKAVYEYFISEVDSSIGTYSNFIKYIKSNSCSSLITIFITDYKNLFTDYSKKQFSVSKNGFQSADLFHKLVILCFQFFSFQSGKSSESHIYDCLRLNF